VIDIASIEYGQSREFGGHVVLCVPQIPAIENLGDLSRLPTLSTTLIALPMKIVEYRGAPTRVLAVFATKAI